MKNIEVVAAIIKKDDKIFITRRGYGEFIDMWEFPGGKIEKGELREEALIREIDEELELKIEVKDLVTTIEYDYPNFHLIMHCFLCEVIGGELKLNAHNDVKWVLYDDLDNQKWVPADVLVVDELKKYF
ncbi:mutator mutT protein [Clostridium thermobutyricum]|uniref:8-oxo-dGTP diphosphatase n=1 Tax=Clostridium thermobutyricum TaxID=29372 RepID=N9XS39_9CLOT|nr:(deoxy)nucleoside triphosphate pyrophosphohydrolase [Clostridium thermobutyricum]ENZ02528.1 mutator mutT protein [Clostridium thermobutyricum]